MRGLALPSPFLRLSVALHVALALLFVVFPDSWKPLLGILVANHALLAAGGLWPRSRLLGPNLRRLPEDARRAGEVGLSFDDGPDPVVTPQVLELLDRRGARATFFCVGVRAERHPELVAEIARRGHRVENHSYRHSSLFFFLGPRALAAEIDRAQSALERAAGSRPRYFRAPAGIRSPWLEGVLAARGLRLVSWTRRGFDTRRRDARRVASRLTSGLAAGDVLLLHDRGSARDAAGRPVVLEALERVLDELERRGLRAVPIPAPAGEESSPARRRLGQVLAEMHYELRTEGDSAPRTGWAVALGTWIGCLPLYGGHLLLSFGLAKLFRLSAIKTYLAAHINNPLTAPGLLYLELGVGRWLATGAWPELSLAQLRSLGALGLGRDLLLGGVVVGVVAAAVLGPLAYAIRMRWRRSTASERLCAAAARPYVAAGVWHWEFVRGKLRHDPLYRELLLSGALPVDGSVLDLGCGRGIALALIRAARRWHRDGRWETDWPAPPLHGKLRGVDSRPSLARVARTALDESVSIEVADLRQYEPPTHRVILLLDVLHYLPAEAQEALIRKSRRALEPGGALLIREPDADGGLRFWMTRFGERSCAILRGAWRQRFHYRSAQAWSALLESEGLSVRESPMWSGTPFANVLLEARAVTSPRHPPAGRTSRASEPAETPGAAG